jgi:tetratricopeptide (TPR) repeat protein
LNFAIIKVDDNYVWLGVLVFLLLILLAFRRNLISAFLITACYLISPAVLVAASRIAWTPIAERYLYLSSAFFAIGIVGALYLLAGRFKREHWLVPSLLAVFLPMTVFTSQRIVVWQDNLTLYQDTLKKSPDFLSLRNELAIALMASGKSAEADVELEAGKKSDPSRRNVLLYVNQAKLKLQAGKPEEARAILLEVAADKKTAHLEVLKMLAKVDERRLFTAKGPKKLKAVQAEILDTHDHLYLKTGDPMSLYRGGQMALYLGDKEKAAGYFQKAYDKAPEGTYYRPAAKKLADKLRL